MACNEVVGLYWYPNWVWFFNKKMCNRWRHPQFSKSSKNAVKRDRYSTFTWQQRQNSVLIKILCRLRKTSHLRQEYVKKRQRNAKDICDRLMYFHHQETSKKRQKNTVFQKNVGGSKMSLKHQKHTWNPPSINYGVSSRSFGPFWRPNFGRFSKKISW